jgi:23S rRNA pseudouridine955/2504/2580 synthase
MKTENHIAAKSPMPQGYLAQVNDAGQRLDNLLLRLLKGVPKSRIYLLVRQGQVRVNKKRKPVSYRIESGDLIRIPPVRIAELSPTPKVTPAVRTLAQQLVYEDTQLLVLNKPSGWAVHGGSGLSFGVIEAMRALRTQDRYLELVHRLDRETSGCLLLAKTRAALKALHQQFSADTVQKYYLAFVAGTWRGPNKIDAPLQKNTLCSGERMVKVEATGKPALTYVKAIHSFKGGTLVWVKPISGRTHQIRVHLQFMGHPIAGDDKYGDKGFNQACKAIGLNRLFLHAAEIELRLPQSEQTIVVHSPLDETLQTFVGTEIMSLLSTRKFIYDQTR